MARDITPEAPCPSTLCNLKLAAGSVGTVAILSSERLKGLPEKANHASFGKLSN